MTFPTAPSYLAAVLRTPRHNSSLDDKLVHNSRVYHFFKEQGLHYNSKHLLRARDEEATAPKMDGLRNLSRLSELRLDKLRKSLAISKLVGREQRPAPEQSDADQALHDKLGHRHAVVPQEGNAPENREVPGSLKTHANHAPQIDDAEH